MPMFTQLSTVKTRLGLTDASDDATLSRIIQAVSIRFDMFCNRRLGRDGEAIEEFSGDETEIRVRSYPIEAVASFELKESEREGWQVLSPSPDWLVRRGCVISLHCRMGTWRQRGRVLYTGGYVLPGDEVKAGQTPLPEDIQHACVEQVAYWYQNRAKLGLVSVTDLTGSTIQYAQQDMLQSVKSTLQRYSRWLV